MTTCEPLPDGGATDEPLTLFAVDSLANPSASPGRSSRRPTSGGSGQPSRASFASYDPATSLWRTFQGSLFEEWETYSETWPASGMTRNGTAYQRPTSAPRISASGSGLLPTPSAVSYGTNQGGGMGRVGPVRPSLDTMARHNLWPTPKGSAANYGRPRENDWGDLQAAVLQWPTPRASDGAGASSHGRTWSTTDRNLHTVMRELGETENGGQLNPTWVEWLMGYPEGWTDCGD